MDQVIQYPQLADIQVPEYYFDIHLSTWEEVAMVFVREVAQQLHPDASDPVAALTDEAIQQLRLPDVASLADLKQYARGLFQKTQIEHRFYRHILPFVGAYLAETAQVVIDAQARDAYVVAAMARVAQRAEQEGHSLATYAAQLMDQAEEPLVALKESFEEEYLFRLIASDWYHEQGLGTTELDYDAYIQQQAIHYGDDEIELREQLPFEAFQLDIPAITYTDALYAEFAPRFRFVIDGATA